MDSSLNMESTILLFCARTPKLHFPRRYRTKMVSSIKKEHSFYSFTRKFKTLEKNRRWRLKFILNSYLTIFFIFPNSDGENGENGEMCQVRVDFFIVIVIILFINRIFKFSRDLKPTRGANSDFFQMLALIAPTNLNITNHNKSAKLLKVGLNIIIF